jgi:hypothetical protein
MKTIKREELDDLYINEDPPYVKKKKNTLKQSFKELKEEKKRHLKNISLNYSEFYDDCILGLIAADLYPSRSEVIRTAIREFLFKEYNNLQIMGYFDEQG